MDADILKPQIHTDEHRFNTDQDEFFDARCTDKARAMCKFGIDPAKPGSEKTVLRTHDLPDQLFQEVKKRFSGGSQVVLYGGGRACGKKYMAKRLERYLKWRLAAAKYGQWLATFIAVAGVILNNGQVIWCFPLWIVSNAITAVYHARARLWGLFVRDVVFIGLAVTGWIQWKYF